MNALLPASKYIVAVSGGIDSVALLHMLQADPRLELIVAHFNHGIREDSVEDTAFVGGLADLYGLEFVSSSARLGAGASEATARHHRYDFLRDVQARHGAQAIVTAHHQDDFIETAVLNLMRGTKRRGLVSLRSTTTLQRPLLKLTKEEIREYVIEHRLEWVEDSTNLEMKYGRNQVRARLYKYLTRKKRNEIANLLYTIDQYNSQIEVQLNEILMNSQQRLKRELITATDEVTTAEIIAAWLRNNQTAFDKTTIERVITGAKELRNGSKIDIDKRYYCLLTKHEIVLTGRESV